MSVTNSMGRYVLFVGTLEPRKNLPGLLEAWDRIKHRHPETSLVIVGAAGHVFRNPSYPALSERVQWMGYVPDDELATLYAGAEAFVLPSLDEGFGLTALEAMACGTPAIVSDGGALPELVGEAALVFDLTDPMGLSRVLEECLADSRLRASLKERGLKRAKPLSWQASAELVWKTIHEA